MRRGNMAAVKKAAQQVKDKQNEGGWTRRLSLGEGESTVVYFPAEPYPEDIGKCEPYMQGRHYMQGAGYFFCSGPETCPACLAYQRGNSKQFKEPQQVGTFNVVDISIYHKVPHTGRERRKFDYFKCSEDIKCKYCRKKEGEKLYGGRKIATWAVSHLEALRAQDERIANYCNNCHTGKISVYEYQCSNCLEVLDWVPDDNEEEEDVVLKCPECRQKVHPQEAIECSKCDKPERATFYRYGAPVTVTRTGQGTKTAYNFTIEWPPPELEEWVLEEEQTPYDLEKVCAPEEPKALAARLNISPGGKRAAPDAAGYDDDPFDDDDEDEKPVQRSEPSRRGKPGRLNRKPAVEQDEDIPF